jgi:multicomponent Na+:H+ antiporter subunit D
MSALLALPIVLPIIGAAAAILVGRLKALQRAISIAVLTANVVLAGMLLVRVDDIGVASLQAGGWRAPMGITLVADRFSALMLFVATVMLLAVLVYAIGQPGAERHHVGFQSVYLVLAAGVSGSFLTGDLFNLFVSFEMMLTASYVLMTLGGTAAQVRSGMTYVVISLIASALFMTTLALVYAATGTVNLADLAGKMAELPEGTRTGFSVLLLVVFGIKAALFPLFFWLPDAYPTAPGPVTAVFAGLLTKVGVYAIIRTQTLLFPEDSRSGTLILVVAGLTMLVGVLGAIAQNDVKRILSFNIVSHIGFMMMGLGLFTAAGLAAAVFYTVHHIIAKTSMFLTSGLIEHVGGSGRLNRLGGMVRTAPVVAVLFLVPALSLSGVPPLSGFVGKLGLFQAGLAERSYAIVGVATVVSLLSMYSMMKIWNGAFWSAAREAPEGVPHAVGPLGGPALMIVPTALLALAGVVLGVFGGPLWEFSERAAADLLHPTAYIEQVLQP